MSSCFDPDSVGENIDLFLTLRKTTHMSEQSCKYWLQHEPFYNRFSNCVKNHNTGYAVVSEMLRGFVSKMFSDKEYRKSIPHHNNMIDAVKTHCADIQDDNGWWDNNEPISQESIEEVFGIGNERDER